MINTRIDELDIDDEALPELTPAAQKKIEADLRELGASFESRLREAAHGNAEEEDDQVPHSRRREDADEVHALGSDQRVQR